MIQDLAEHFEPPSTDLSSMPNEAPSNSINEPSMNSVERQTDWLAYLDEGWPRIPVTASMLCGHAFLRGKERHVLDLQGDPVHHALYPVRNRTFGAGRITIPMLVERGSEEE